MLESMAVAVERDGTCYPIGMQCFKLKLVIHRGDIAVFHEAGGRYWSSVTNPNAYARARFHVCKVKTGKAKKGSFVNDGNRRFKLEYDLMKLTVTAVLIDFPARQKGKK